jgi:hypothetical protein
MENPVNAALRDNITRFLVNAPHPFSPDKEGTLNGTLHLMSKNRASVVQQR